MTVSEWVWVDWPTHLSKCKDDDRFVSKSLKEKEVAQLIQICHTCPVEQRCLLWAEAQTPPVGFVVAGGRRWKAWNYCQICGKKVRGTDRCGQHLDLGEPIGTIDADGNSHPYSILDSH